ncbi:unnamed protein product [Adineta ricciae]|uniref:G-protein coupled receptors family 1 profile domain-containing protein n=1 Tax=Adineta ricciae TaxID=249248 RepID=A0A813NU63_ADIRI|nr:unnamed protein product [Adineta ricciae]CAF0744614.1 unnamed protein product [Adineta ricciae]
MYCIEILASILMFLCNLLGIICSLIFISIFIVYRQCRTMTTVLVLNSVVAGFIINVVYACDALYQINLTQADALCIFRGFLLCVTFALYFHTFCVHALYRWFMTIPCFREYLRSKCITLFAIACQWVISILIILLIFWNNGIKFQSYLHTCTVPRDDTVNSIYLGLSVYFFPLLLIIGIYIRLIIYIRTNSQLTVNSQNLADQRRRKHEFRLYRRIIMPVIALFIMGFPYTILFGISQFLHIRTPLYIQRLCFVLITLGQGGSMLLCLINTENIRKYLNYNMRKLKRRQRRIQCINVVQLPIQRLRPR